jgi:hypothetical protein
VLSNKHLGTRAMGQARQAWAKGNGPVVASRSLLSSRNRYLTAICSDTPYLAIMFEADSVDSNLGKQQVVSAEHMLLARLRCKTVHLCDH